MADPVTGLNRLRELWDEPTAAQKAKLPNQVKANLPIIGDVTVPRPPQFQPEPQAIGQEAGQAMNTLLLFAPALQGRIGEVRVGPNQDVVDRIENSNKLQKAIIPPDIEKLYKKYNIPIPSKSGGAIFSNPAEDFSKTNLLGITNMNTGNIGMNPRLYTNSTDDYTIPSVLAHEVTHASGYGEEKEPDEAGKIMYDLLRKQPHTGLDPINSLRRVFKP